MMDTGANHTILNITADVVSAYVGNNPVRAGELPELIAVIHASLAGIGAPKAGADPVPELKPAVSIKKSITNDYLICLEDGRKFKSMKRHLATLGMTPDEYRSKWSLPRDYPMVARAYAATRAMLAKASGLGSSYRAAAEPAASTEDVGTELAAVLAPKRRGRAKTAA